MIIPNLSDLKNFMRKFFGKRKVLTKPKEPNSIMDDIPFFEGNYRIMLDSQSGIVEVLGNSIYFSFKKPYMYILLEGEKITSIPFNRVILVENVSDEEFGEYRKKHEKLRSEI